MLVESKKKLYHPRFHSASQRVKVPNVFHDAVMLIGSTVKLLEINKINRFHLAVYVYKAHN